MARISSYPRELDIADNDAWIGTESSNRSTKNFTAATVAKYLNINGKISISAQMGFKFILNNSPANGEFSGPADNSNIGDITTLQVSSIDTGGQNTVQFMGYLIGSDILISKQNDINTFGHFTISSYVANGAGVYTLSLVLITGGSNGILNKNVFYDFAVFTLSTKNIDDLTYDLDVPTGTTSINLAGSDGTNDAVELFGGTNIGITRDNANRITFTGSAITAGTGIAIVTTSIDETISINYSGTNNAILSATQYLGTDNLPDTYQIWFNDSDAGVNTVGYALISDLPFDNYQHWILSDGTSTATITSTNTAKILGGTYITSVVSPTDKSATITHNATTRTNTTPNPTSTPSPGYGTIGLVTAVTSNTEGHVTGTTTTDVTWPADTDTNYILNKAAGSTDLILSADGTTQNTIQFAGTTNEVTVTGVTEDAYQIGLPDEVTIDTSLTVMGTVQSSFQGQVTIPATPSVATDAASKSYVLSQVGGLGTFQGGYDATSDPGSPVLTGASNIAVGTGDFYTVTTAGAITFSDSPTGDATLEVGDFIFANSDIVAGSSPASTDYTLVLADQNIAGAGTTDGNTAKGIAGFNSTQFSVSPTGWVQSNNNGTVTGTGVANKVAYWTSATNIDDGPITFATNDSTFAGSVVVNGTSTFIPISTVNYIVTNSGNALRLISGIPSGVTWIGKPVEYYASEYSFSTDVTGVGGYSQQFVIENNGNVGIGETSPESKLEISDTSVGTDPTALDSNFLMLTNKDLGTGAEVWGMGFNARSGVTNYLGAFVQAYGYFQTAGNTGLIFGTRNTSGVVAERMRIDDDGNVGIGDTTPTSKLTILGASTAASNTPSDAIVDIHGTSTAHLLMGVANVSPYGAWINTDATGQPLVLQGTGGNVGIGTASPAYPLEVESSGGNAYVFSENTAAGGASGFRWKTPSSEFAWYSAGANDMNLYDYTASAIRMTIDSSGFGYIYNNFYLASAANQGNLFFGTADSQYNIFGGGTYGYMGYNTSGYHRFLTSGTERMRITSTGIVEIGTITSVAPALLSVRKNGTCIEYGHGNNNGRYEGTLGAFGSSGFPYIGFSTSCDNSVNTFTTRGWKGNVINSNDYGDLIFAQATNANASGQTLTERMRIQSDGVVYVSGQNNGYDGTIRIGERAYIEHRDAGQTTTSIISNYNHDNAKINFKLKGVADAAAQMTILGSGNVGINDTNPGTKLSVNGANYVEMATFSAATGSTAGIISANSGFVTSFSNSSTHVNSNTAVFSPVANGIKILKAGLIQVSTNQDFVSTGASSYASVAIYKNSTGMFYSLRTNSNSQWDMLQSSGTMIVAANDVIGFYYAATDFTSMDAGSWSQYSFVWTSR